MPSLNRYECIGHLGRYPTLGEAKGGKPVLRFSLAVDKPNSDEPMWLNIVVWEDLALRMQELLKKGMLVYIDGRLVIREYVPKGKDPSDPMNKKLAVDIVATNIQILSKIQKETNEQDSLDADDSER